LKNNKVRFLNTGCPAALLLKKIENRNFRIEKIGKIGNFASKHRRKIGKSIELLFDKDSLPAPNQLSQFSTLVHQQQ